MSQEDLEFVREIVQGRIGFDVLDARYRAFIYRFCLQKIRHREDAENLVQETLLKAFLKLASFRGESSLRTWLCEIAFREFLILLRKRQGKEFIPLDEVFLRTARAEGADLQINRVNACLLLEKIFQELPTGQFRVFVLHDVVGYEHNEIAPIIQRSAGNSKSQLHRARVRLVLEVARLLGFTEEQLSAWDLPRIRQELRKVSSRTEPRPG